MAPPIKINEFPRERFRHIALCISQQNRDERFTRFAEPLLVKAYFDCQVQGLDYKIVFSRIEYTEISEVSFDALILFVNDASVLSDALDQIEGEIPAGERRHTLLKTFVFPLREKIDKNNIPIRERTKLCTIFEYTRGDLNLQSLLDTIIERDAAHVYNLLEIRRASLFFLLFGSHLSIFASEPFTLLVVPYIWQIDVTDYEKIRVAGQQLLPFWPLTETKERVKNSLCYYIHQFTDIMELHAFAATVLEQDKTSLFPSLFIHRYRFHLGSTASVGRVSSMIEDQALVIALQTGFGNISKEDAEEFYLSLIKFPLVGYIFVEGFNSNHPQNQQLQTIQLTSTSPFVAVPPFVNRKLEEIAPLRR